MPAKPKKHRDRVVNTATVSLFRSEYTLTPQLHCSQFRNIYTVTPITSIKNKDPALTEQKKIRQVTTE